MERRPASSFSDDSNSQVESLPVSNVSRAETQVFLKPMETFHCAPDDTIYKGERIEKYFNGVIEQLNYNNRAKEVFLNIEYKTPYLEGEADKVLNPTDDCIGYLTARDRLIAFILETRTASNFIQVVMGCTLTEDLLVELQAKKELLNEKESTVLPVNQKA